MTLCHDIFIWGLFLLFIGYVLNEAVIFLTPKAEPKTFDTILAEYVTLHREMVTGKKHPRYFYHMRCPPRESSTQACPGWGDQVKGILFGFTLALVEQRAFVLTSKEGNYFLDDIYDTSLINWGSHFEPSNTYVDCWIRDSCDCFMNQDSNYFLSGMDCAGYVLRTPQYRQVGEIILKDAMWRTKIYDALFKYREPFKKYNTVVHVRIGGSYMFNGVRYSNMMQQGDNIQYPSTDLRDIVRSFQECVIKWTKDPVVLLCSDTPEVFTLYSSAETNQGKLGHQGKNTEVSRRLHVEFEQMRHATLLLAGESGLSLMAYHVRAHASQVVIAAWKPECDWAFKVYTVYG